MKKSIITLTLLAAVSGTAMAQSAFDGPFVQLGIGGSSSSSTINGFNYDNGSPVSADGRSNQGSFNGMLEAGYSQAIANSAFNIAGNIFYVIGNQNAGQGASSATWSDSDGPMYQSISANAKLQNTFGIWVEPGYYVTKTTLPYVKLGWVNSGLNVNASGFAQDLITGETANGGGNWSSRINGFGYGLGVKQMFTDNIYGAVDVYGVNYGTASVGDGMNIKNSQVTATASIGYKF